MLNANSIRRYSCLTWMMTILVGLYFAFTPLDYIAKLGGGNASLLRIFGIGIYFLGIVRLFLTRRVMINSFHIELLFLMAFPFLACLWAINQSTGFDRAFTIFTTILVVLFATITPFDERQVRLLELFSVVGAVTVGVILISNQGLVKFLSGGRIYLSGSMDTSDPNGMAGRLVLPLFISIKLFLEEEKWYRKIVVGIAVGLIILLFFMCGSRGGLLSVFVALVIVVLFCSRNSKYRIRNGTTKGRTALILFLVSTIVIFLIFAEDILPEYIYGRLFSINGYSSKSSRVYIWETFFNNIFWSSPIIGFGPFGVYYLLGRELGFPYYAMHNSYLCMIGEYGLLYLPIFITMLISVHKRIRLNGTAIHFLIFYSTCGVIFFLDGYETKFFWNMIIYCLICCNMSTNNQALQEV